jgi:hypothetical protein
MEKKCFVIMPKKGSPDGYAQGHFNRVFQYIIVPACRYAGFSASRADDPGASEAPLDMLNTIIDSEMVICDLSGGNAHGLYGFAIREALRLPVILIRDMKSKSVDVHEFEYDDSLRIDTVEQEIETLGKALNEAFANKGEPNATLNRLGIGAAALPAPSQETAAATEVIEDEPVQKKESRIPVISPLPSFVGDPITQLEVDTLKIGDTVFHLNYGTGEIKAIKKLATDKLATLQFGSDSKTVVLGTSGILRKIKA